MTLDPMYMFQNSQGLPKCSQNSNAIQTAPNPFLGSTKLWSVQNLPANKVVLLQLLLPLLILPHMSKHLSLSSSHMEWALCGRCHPETYCYLHCKLLHCCSIVQVWNWGLVPGSCDLNSSSTPFCWNPATWFVSQDQISLDLNYNFLKAY
jgi:hypothetical protein